VVSVTSGGLVKGEAESQKRTVDGLPAAHGQTSSRAYSTSSRLRATLARRVRRPVRQRSAVLGKKEDESSAAADTSRLDELETKQAYNPIGRETKYALSWGLAGYTSLVGASVPNLLLGSA
jgi:hypothetical protein